MLLGAWDDALSSKLDDEMRARITGVSATMHTFDFLFGVSLGNVLLNQTDHLSKNLHLKTVSCGSSWTSQSDHWCPKISTRTRKLQKLLHSLFQVKNRFQISDTTPPRKKEINTAIAITGVREYMFLGMQKMFSQI